MLTRRTPHSALRDPRSALPRIFPAFHWRLVDPVTTTFHPLISSRTGVVTSVRCAAWTRERCAHVEPHAEARKRLERRCHMHGRERERERE